MADTRRGSRPVTLVAPLSTQGLDRFAHFAIYHLPDGHLDVLGAGGMGTTYRAFDLQLERPVALKVIHPQHFYHPDVRSRFLREAKAAARLQHPNIAGVLYQGEENGICFYAMELVSGEDLENYVHRVGPLPPVAALQICHQVLLGLDAAYQVQLLHRDLKPANIMLTRYHDHRIPHVKVIDFGLAKFIQDAPTTLVTRAGFMGTPGYASPEQCQEMAVDCRSDLYSLGAVLWFLLAGREIFEGSTLSIIQSHVHEEPDYSVLPIELGPVQLVLQRLLAKKPEDRPESPMHAIRDVEYAIEALGGPAASTLPPVELKFPPPGLPPTLLDATKSKKTGASKALGNSIWQSRWYWIAGGTAALVLIGLLLFWLVISYVPDEHQFSLDSSPQPFGQNSPRSSGLLTAATVPTYDIVEDSVPKSPPEEATPEPSTVMAPSKSSVPENSPAPSEPPSESVFNLAPEAPGSLPTAIPPLTLPPVPTVAEKPAEVSAPAVPVVPVRPDATGEKINSLGMKFVPIPFVGGDNWICVWETRLKDYRTFALAMKKIPQEAPSWRDPRFIQTDNDPVVFVSVQDAAAFCRWLTQKEKDAGLIKPYQLYRLPTRLEIDAASGRLPPGVITQLQQKFPDKTFSPTPQSKYVWGDKWPPGARTGNFADITTYYATRKRAIPKYDDGFANTSPVGTFAANSYGVFDLAGNVWELTSTPDGKTSRVGGGWASFEEKDFSPKDAVPVELNEIGDSTGFRCVLVDETLATSFKPPGQNGGGRGEDQQRPEPPNQPNRP